MISSCLLSCKQHQKDLWLVSKERDSPFEITNPISFMYSTNGYESTPSKETGRGLRCLRKEERQGGWFPGTLGQTPIKTN